MKALIIGVLKCVAILPLRILYLLSDFIYLIVYRLLKYRRKVVRQNLTEAFPDKSPEEISKIERDFYHHICDIIVETIKLLSISDRELQQRIVIRNSEIVEEAIAHGKSAVIMLGHYGNWEWVQHISRHFDNDALKTSIYHPLKNELWNDVYMHLRSRWQINLIPQQQAAKKLLNKDNQPWICGFIADARPWTKTEGSSTPFLSHETSFIYGPEVIGFKVGAEMFFLEMERVKRGSYAITFHPLHPIDDGSPYPYSRAFWKEFENVIRRNPAYWLWSHKRWKNDTLLS